METLNINIDNEGGITTSQFSINNKSELDRYIEEYLQRREKRKTQNLQEDLTKSLNVSQSSVVGEGTPIDKGKDLANSGQSALAAAGAAGIALTKRAAMTATGMVGLFTDNQAQQNSVDNALSIGTKAYTFGAGVVSAGLVGGPVFAAITAVTLLANEALTVATNALATSKQNLINKEEYYRNQERLGIVETGRNR